MRRITAIIAVALALAACSGPRGEAPWLLRTVPSRSVEIMHFRHAGHALELLLDSTHVFRSLDLGRLEGTEMVLSYDFAPGRVPLLSLDAGRYRTDTSETVKSLLEQAQALKLQAAYVTDSVRRNVALLLTPSTAALSDALIHIAAGTSILDADDFTDALSKADGREGFVMLRNSAGAQLLPKDFMADVEVPRSLLGRFVAGACKWTVVSFDACRTEGLRLAFSPLGPDRWYLSVFEGLSGGDSALGKILPEGADWVVDLPLSDWSAFYDARCRWMDSCSMLSAHERSCNSAAKAWGLSPRKWFETIRPKELARFRWEGHSVTAVRCTKAPKVKGIAPNKYPGYTAMVFGSIFSEPVGAVCMTTKGRWLVFGTPEDVEAFREAVPGEESFGRKVKYAVVEPEFRLCCTDKETVLNLYK